MSLRFSKSSTVCSAASNAAGAGAAAGATGAGGAGIPRVTISNDSSLAANQSVNLAQVAGTATVTAGTTRNALTDASSTAPGTTATTGHIATTKPQRSATLHLLDLSFNAYGGIVRWVASPDEVISVVGNSASLGEVSLSAFTGGTTGAMSGHTLYEVV